MNNELSIWKPRSEVNHSHCGFDGNLKNVSKKCIGFDWGGARRYDAPMKIGLVSIYPYLINNLISAKGITAAFPAIRAIRMISEIFSSIRAGTNIHEMIRLIMILICENRNIDQNTTYNF